MKETHGSPEHDPLASEKIDAQLKRVTLGAMHIRLKGRLPRPSPEEIHISRAEVMRAENEAVLLDPDHQYYPTGPQ